VPAAQWQAWPLAGLMDQKALLDESTVRKAIARSLALCTAAHGPAVDPGLTPPCIPARNKAPR
jgi:hypothetical protein